MCSSAGSRSQQVTEEPKFFGPFGENSIPGASSARSYVYGQAGARRGTAQENRDRMTGYITSAAENPVLAESVDLARRQIRGDYLDGSPQLADYLDRIQSMAERGGADEEAAIRSRFQRGGVNFSTGQQLASQGVRAARRTQGEDNASRIMFGNYGQERQIQQRSPGMAESSLAAPINFLGQLNPALYDDLSKESDLIMKMATGGGLATPNVSVVQKPGALDYATQILGVL